ncbi:hypothetical protein COCSADRAFT_346074 [Bipolaris sorokiniana ND90Pr]|uniref:Cytochrome P450 n=1 Tax=Cochliobolus sativus (strain ND90Pr / ATCC 201652) TaxID=665912 RepID=M2SE11_COCSN|nr:uncharacterized protein COCSADRAFT_346074 [Bipolaris sorokiniana ND90Pr]EMD60705.1 hypothetical protein COCSADRAFT_346074 [Bipolaris sorokiniana ND90Pr]
MSSSLLILLCTAVIFVYIAIIAITVLSTVAHKLLTRQIPHNAPPEVRDNYPVIGPWGFWKRRWDWYKECISQSETGNFSFHAGPNMVIGLSGDTARKMFFESRQLRLAEGYADIDGAPTSAEKLHNSQETDEGIDKWFASRLSQLLKGQYLQNKLPDLKSKINESIDTIQKEPSGIIDAFDSMACAIYKLTMGTFGPNELLSDPKKLKQTQSMFESIVVPASPMSILFPKLPSLGALKKLYTSACLFFMLQSMIKKRVTSDKKPYDAMQVMLDQGHSIFKITLFVFGAVFAGMVNSTVNSGWLISYLAAAPEWQDKVRQEVRKVAAKYARDTTAPLRQQLDDIPIEAWESEFPLINACLRDLIRLHIITVYFRKNMTSDDIPLGNGKEVIPGGAVVAYPSYDIHLNPEVYTNPYEWDPSRYMPERAEDTKRPHGYVGWGSGMHPCLGMRFATLEITMVTAYFVASFDFQLVDKNGNRLFKVPDDDFNRKQVQAPKIPPYVKFTSREK